MEMKKRQEFSNEELMRMMGYERPSLKPETEVAMKTAAPVSGELIKYRGIYQAGV